MCGIAGIYSTKPKDSKALRTIVNTMIKGLIHRGPDGQGIKVLNKNICIGNARLGIVDRANGKQPISIGKQLSIVFNGEVYNYKDIQKRHLSSAVFSTKTDTEVIIQGYKKFGLNIFSQLNGMFAVCIVDGNKLILARDRIGVKPLYYRLDSKALSFASEIKVLLNKDESYSIPDYYKFFETTINGETFFNNVIELPPGSILTYDGKIVEVVSYWNLNHKIDFVTEKSEAQLVEELRYLIVDAIEIRKPDLDFGVTISGGLDSAIIACISKPSYLFTSITKESGLSEEEYADLLSDHLDTPLIKMYPNKDDFIRTLPNLIQALDAPTTTLAAYPMYQLFSEITKYVKVTLNGQGADELYGGYVRYVLFYLEYLSRNASELKSYSALATHFWGNQHIVPLGDRYLKLLSRSNGKIPVNDELKSILSKSDKRPITSAGIVDLLISFPPLLRTDDRLSMAWSVETRSPFLDYRIVEFALSLPDRYKIKTSNVDGNNGTFITKHLIREAIGDLLPKSILNRMDKVGYPSPVATWLQNDFSNLVRNIKVRTNSEFSSSFPEPPRTRGSFDRFNWQLLQLSIWKWIFIEKRSIQSIRSDLLRFV